MTDVHTAQPGWYPEPDGTEGQRWWDGSRWTEYATPLAAPPYEPYGTARTTVPEGTPTGNVWIWLVAVLPILPFIPFFFVDVSGYMLRSMTDPMAQFAMYLDPMYLATTLLGWAVYGASVWFAALDRRELRRLGYSRPFHWAWAFLWSLVYVVGRTVVVRRQAGRGSGPMAVAIAVNVAIVIGTFVWAGMLFASLMDATMGSYPGV